MEKSIFFLNKITPVDLDQKQEPKTEDKTQNATHETNVKITGGKKDFFKNEITPVDVDLKPGEYTINKRKVHLKGNTRIHFSIFICNLTSL